MKSFFIARALMVAVVLLYSCADHEGPTTADTQLTFTVVAPGHLPDDASLLISISSGSGTTILDQEEVKLERIGHSYASHPLDLPVGNYRITDFMVTDIDGKILFATPQKGSQLDNKNNDALPYEFSWGQDHTMNVTLPVLDAAKHLPNKFGYDSFKGRANPFKVEVFIPELSGLQITEAEAIILKGLDTLRLFPLTAKTNTIVFRGDPEENYTLVIVKDAYSRYSREFTFKDLIAELQHKPLNVVLQPALSLIAIPAQGQHYFGMQFDAWGTFDFNVDWGDGTNEVWTSGITNVLDHYYPACGKYFISITGHALDSATNFGNLNGSGDIGRVSLDHLPNLWEFRMEYTPGPKLIDLSHSTFLTELKIIGTEVEEVIIPDNTFIYNFDFGGNTKLKYESLNEVINDLYHQTLNSQKAGFFWYSLLDNNDIPMVTPSPAALEQLRILKNTYGWWIVPDPDL